MTCISDIPTNITFVRVHYAKMRMLFNHQSLISLINLEDKIELLKKFEKAVREDERVKNANTTDVFVITEKNYLSYTIRGVYTTDEKALLARMKFSKITGKSIECFPVDKCVLNKAGSKNVIQFGDDR